MPPNRPDPDDGEPAAGRTRQKAHNRLAQARKTLREEDSDLRAQIIEATLVASGELGYGKTSVAAVLERYGGNRVQFYKNFANLGEAYATAHATYSDRLAGELLRAGAAEGSWRDGLRASLLELRRFVERRPALANGLLLQAHLAGEPVLGKRQEVLERLSHAVDTARREIRSRHSPPPLTARFIVSAIEATVLRALAEGETEQLEAAIPELEALATCFFFGRPD